MQRKNLYVISSGSTGGTIVKANVVAPSTSCPRADEVAPRTLDPRANDAMGVKDVGSSICAIIWNTDYGVMLGVNFTHHADIYRIGSALLDSFVGHLVENGYVKGDKIKCNAILYGGINRVSNDILDNVHEC